MDIKGTIEDIIREDLAEIWSILNSDEKHLIAENFVVHTYRKGQIIYAEKDEPQFLWVLIKGKVNVASTMAIEPSQVGTIPMSVVKQLIDGNMKLAWFFIHELSKHLGGSDSKVVTLTQKHIRGRLAEALCMLVDNYGYEDDGKTLKIYMAREDLANLSNMTTANAIRTLSTFAQERIITVDGRRIRIVDESTLRNISRFG